MEALYIGIVAIYGYLYPLFWSTLHRYGWLFYRGPWNILSVFKGMTEFYLWGFGVSSKFWIFYVVEIDYNRLVFGCLGASDDDINVWKMVAMVAFELLDGLCNACCGGPVQQVVSTAESSAAAKLDVCFATMGSSVFLLQGIYGWPCEEGGFKGIFRRSWACFCSGKHFFPIQTFDKAGPPWYSSYMVIKYVSW